MQEYIGRTEINRRFLRWSPEYRELIDWSAVEFVDIDNTAIKAEALQLGDTIGIQGSAAILEFAEHQKPIIAFEKEVIIYYTYTAWLKQVIQRFVVNMEEHREGLGKFYSNYTEAQEVIPNLLTKLDDELSEVQNTPVIAQISHLATGLT